MVDFKKYLNNNKMAKKQSLKERLAEKQKRLKDKSGGFKFFMVKEGTSRFRILNVGEENDWSIEATVFYLGKDMGFIVSPKTFGEKCAIMEAYEELSNSKKTSDREVANRFKPGRKFFVPAVRYKDEKGKELESEEVKPLMVTPGIVGEMIELWTDEDEAGDFTDPKNGYDLKFTRVGKTKTDTEYSVRACKPTPVPSKKLQKLVIDPEELLKGLTPSYKETKVLLDKFLNLPTEEESNEEEKPRKKKKKRSKDL